MAVNSYRDDEQMDNTSRKKILRRLLGYLFVYKGTVCIVLLIMAAAIGISLVNPLLIEEALDHYVAGGDDKGLVRLGLAALALNLVFIVLVKLRMYLMSVVSNKILLVIRQDLYEHIQTLSFSFFDSRPTGKILARIIGDVNALKDVFVNAVTTLLPEFVTVAGVVVIMAVKDWRLALASLSTIPLMAAGIWFVQKASHRRWQIYRKKSSNLNAYVHEDIAGMSVVRSFSAQDETGEIFGSLADDHRDAFQDACRYADLFGPVIDFSWGIGAMMLYLIGIRVLGMQRVSVGMLVAFGSYINMFWNPIMNLSNFYNQLITNIAGAERIFEILDTQPEIADREGVAELPEVRGKVEFKNVSFAYDRDTQVLDNVSFQIRPGETIALVGPTGAGKTTIVNLIIRFYDVTGGAVYIDGHDIREVSIESLRQQMGIMTQENFLFSGTIKDNIRYGRLDATDEEIMEAAKMVNAHEFIMKMEKGYDTELKERGAGLSIGQRQLLAFARTMLSMPKILILDEATSSIDTHTERLVQKGIDALLAGRTSFVIAHRLSTIQKADRIFVIDKGGIVEQGSAKELIEKKGAYYELYMAQFKEVA